MRIALLVVAAGACASVALADPTPSVPIPGLFNTGVDNGGNLLAAGAPDFHYSVLENAGNPGAVMTPPLPGTYLPNDGDSQWIWENADGQPTNVTRTFRLTFDLTGLDPNTAWINGLWGTDNTGLDILINGASTGQTSGGFSSLTSFSITSGFVPGINTLDFVVYDYGVISGFRVDEISGMASIPTPGAAALLGVGGLAALRRRR